jgi:hypothetical protein
MACYIVPENIKRITLEELDSEIVPKPSRLEVVLSSGEVLRVYRVCYLDRGYQYSKLEGVKYPYRNVNTESFSEEREKLVNKLILDVFINHEHKIATVLRFLDFVDDPKSQKYFGSVSFDTIDNAKHTYAEITKWLFHQMIGTSGINKDVKVMSSKKGWSMQDAMAHLFATAHNLSVNEVKMWGDLVIETGSYALNSDKNFSVNEFTDEQQLRTNALHTELFNYYSEIVIKHISGKPQQRPLLVPFNGLIDTDFVMIDEGRHTWSNRKHVVQTLSSLWDEEGNFTPHVDGIVKNIERTGVSTFKQYALLDAAKIISDFLIERPHFDDFDIAKMANFAQQHFIYALAYESGANSHQLTNADYSKATNDPNNKSQRIFEIKGRGQNKEVPIRWDIKNFGPAYKRFVQLTKALKKFCPDYGGVGISWFSCKKSERIDRDNYIPSLRASHKTLAKDGVTWPKDMPWISISNIRPLRDLNIMESSGNNVNITASMQGRGIETTIAIYLQKVSVNKAALELAPFFMAYREAARAHSGKPDVIVTDRGEKTHAAHCVASEGDQPERALDLNGNSIDPKCGSPATCFNCKHFALHADEEDIIKVLSLKYWLELQGKVFSRNIDEFNIKYGALIDRADAILEDFAGRSEKYKEVLVNASKKASLGDFDKYWTNKINAIIDLV